MGREETGGLLRGSLFMIIQSCESESGQNFLRRSGTAVQRRIRSRVSDGTSKQEIIIDGRENRVWRYQGDVITPNSHCSSKLLP